MNDQWNIVICDDDTVFIELLKNHIEREADKIGVVCEIVSYSDGNLLLKQKAMKGDLYFIDIEMPEMDGHRLTKLVKSDDATKDIPIIIFSSLVNDDMKRKGEALGADAQLSKPEIGNLVRIVDELVAEKHLDR